MSDFYYDDPVEETSGTRRNFKGILSLILVIAVGGTYLQTTLAANISLNSGLVVNFGQGIAATTACSGSTSLIVTPISSFANVSGGGAFYFSSVKVSNIPTSCYGKDFTINAYNNSSNTPLAIFNSTATSAVVYNNAGTFEAGSGMTGATVSRGTGTFTVTFTNPVATASNVFKLTIQSSNHTEAAGAYSVGEIGPGGGKIFYYSAAGFNCGEGYSATGSPTGGKCNYLEAAPSLWSGLEAYDGDQEIDIPVKDSAFAFANVIQDLNEIGVNKEGLGGFGTRVPQVGRGYKNSLAIIAQGNNATTAAGAASAYRGGTKSDWYLPSLSEMNLLCQWAKGVTLDATTACPISGTPTQTGAGFEVLWDAVPDDSPRYSTSSEDPESAPLYGGVSWVWILNMSDGSVEPFHKAQAGRVRPIRAF